MNHVSCCARAAAGREEGIYMLLQYFTYESSVSIRNDVFVEVLYVFRYKNRITDWEGLVV